MTVYVDNARIPARINRTASRWSHLTADTVAELHEFAARIGLRPEWFQTCKRRCDRTLRCVHWHYDVTDSLRSAAIASGAVAIDIRQMGALVSERRKAMRAAQA